MKNFGRVLALCLRYRCSVAVSVILAIFVGALWGGNIGAAYPVVEIALTRGSLHEWVDAQIVEAEESAEECTSSIASLEKQLDSAAEGEQRAIRGQIEVTKSRREAELEALARYQWLRPYIFAYLPNDAFRTLALFVGILVIGTAIKSVFLIAQVMLVARISHLGIFELRNLFFRRTLQMDVTTFSREGISDLMSRFTHDTNALVAGLNVMFGKMIREPLKMAACLVGAAIICWRLLILSLVIAPVAALAIRWLAKTLKRANRRAMEEMALLFATLEEAFRGIKVVKAFTMEPRERKRFHANSKEYYRKSMKIARYDSLAHPITEMLGIVTIGLAMLFGAYLVLTGETELLGITMCPRPLSLPALLVFYGLLIGVADPARKLSDTFTRLQTAAAAADRICAMLDREPLIRDPKQAKPLKRHHKGLVFEGVGFSYLPGRPVLKGIDLDVAFGETIGIVGPSGCGKSTLTSLIPRFADPTTGRISVDGIPLNEVRIRQLRRQIGVVTQEPLLFNDTILNNIRYGSSRATIDQVVQAAKQAHAHEFIERDLADGYHTTAGPMGGQLSGGQKQRICLARAILRDPSILILDEATNQIDLQSEQLIQQVLAKFVRGRTVFLVTHRLGTLALADRIVVMQEGQILDIGSHDQLMARCESYRQLHQIQFDDLKESA